MSVAASLLRGFAWFSIWYFAVLNTICLMIIATAAAGVTGARRQAAFAGLDDIFASPLAPPISVVVGVRNLAGLIVDSARGLLNLRYPEFEVIIVDDGSTDGTFARLAREFRLVEVDKVLRSGLPAAGRVRSVHAPATGERLLVIRKDSVGHPADAVHTGVNAAQYPLICRVDADTYLDEDALLRVAKPVIEDPARTVAAWAAVRVANGCELRAGRVVRPRVPGGWLLPIQAAEYLRAFLLGRAGWSQARGMLFMSGGFGVCRREVYELAGRSGLTTGTDGPELTTSTYRWLPGRPHRIAFVPEPCCWTVVPARYRPLAQQRARWAGSLGRALWRHRVMLFNPRYRRAGLLALPFCLAFDLISAVVEAAAWLVLVTGWAAGIIGPAAVGLFAAAALGYGAFLTLVSAAVEELTYHRYRRWRDFALLAYAAVAENIGFRQLHAWWRLRGLAAALLHREVTRLGRPGGDRPGRGQAPVRAPAAAELLCFA